MPPTFGMGNFLKLPDVVTAGADGELVIETPPLSSLKSNEAYD